MFIIYISHHKEPFPFEIINAFINLTISEQCSENMIYTVRFFRKFDNRSQIIYMVDSTNNYDSFSIE